MFMTTAIAINVWRLGHALLRFVILFAYSFS